MINVNLHFQYKEKSIITEPNNHFETVYNEILKQEIEPSAFNQTKYGGNMFYFRIKLDTENASRLASGTKGGATSGWEADRLQPLCLSTRGTFPVFWIRRDNHKQV